MKRISLAILLALPPSLPSLAAAAEPPPLSLAQALATALEKSPALQAESFEARVAEARILQARVRPAPELSLELENALGTGAFSGVKQLETTLRLSQLVELDGARAHRVDVAVGERALADADYHAKRLAVLAEVARRFTEAVADAARLDAAQQAHAFGEKIVAAVRARLDAAVASPIELNKARTTLALLELEEEHAEHELAAHRHALAATLGAAEPKFGPLSADLLRLPKVPEFSALARRLDENPRLARAALETRWRDAQIRLAQSLRRPGARVSAGLRRAEASDAVGIVADVSVPLPARDATAGAVREARERRTQLDATADALRLELRTSLFSMYQEMLHARTALTQLQEQVIPLARETLTLTERAYREGRYSLVELLDAQKALLDLQRQAIDHATTFHLHLIEIEQLLGGSADLPAASATASTAAR